MGDVKRTSIKSHFLTARSGPVGRRKIAVPSAVPTSKLGLLATANRERESPHFLNGKHEKPAFQSNLGRVWVTFAQPLTDINIPTFCVYKCVYFAQKLIFFFLIQKLTSAIRVLSWPRGPSGRPLPCSRASPWLDSMRYRVVPRRSFSNIVNGLVALTQTIRFRHRHRN